MRLLTGLIIILVAGFANSAEQAPAEESALETFERVISASEHAGGFYALEMPKMREFSANVPVTVDTECLNFAIVAGGKDKPMCRKHAEINKLLIVRKQEGNSFALRHPGDHEIVVFYKGVGKLIVLDVIEQDIDPFIEAVRALSPVLKKIKDRR